jgi:hypothetical protein
LIRLSGSPRAGPAPRSRNFNRNPCGAIDLCDAIDLEPGLSSIRIVSRAVWPLEIGLAPQIP